MGDLRAAILGSLINAAIGVPLGITVAALIVFLPGQLA